MREWFADYLEACNRHDLEALRSLIDPAVRRAHLPGGVDAWLSDLAELYSAFPDWQVRRIQLVIEEDRIAAHLRAGGTHTSTFRGIPPTGRHANVAEFGFTAWPTVGSPSTPAAPTPDCWRRSQADEPQWAAVNRLRWWAGFSISSTTASARSAAEIVDCPASSRRSTSPPNWYSPLIGAGTHDPKFSGGLT